MSFTRRYYGFTSPTTIAYFLAEWTLSYLEQMTVMNGLWIEYSPTMDRALMLALRFIGSQAM